LAFLEGLNLLYLTILKGKYLNLNDHFSASVLDPRYPQVRKFIVDKYLHELKEWGPDETIAYELGYSDQAYFTRMFSKAEKTSRQAFRDKNR
jgi:alpha-galactosidase